MRLAKPRMPQTAVVVRVHLFTRLYFLWQILLRKDARVDGEFVGKIIC